MEYSCVNRNAQAPFWTTYECNLCRRSDMHTIVTGEIANSKVITPWLKVLDSTVVVELGFGSE